MTTFDDRENAFEAHFAFEEELKFKARARRDRLVALWAGGLMGLKDGPLEDYVIGLVRADLRDPEGDEVYQKVLVDLADKGLHVRPQEVRDHVEQLMAEARSQVGADARADEA